MTDKEKLHDIAIAFNLIEKVLGDTDEELWAYDYLEEAKFALEEYFECCYEY